jgi:hypothetical protein
MLFEISPNAFQTPTTKFGQIHLLSDRAPAILAKTRPYIKLRPHQAKLDKMRL